MNEKHTCNTCEGIYTFRNKSAHMKTKKHIASVVDDEYIQLYATLTTEQKKNIMISMKNMTNPVIIHTLPEPIPEIEKYDTNTDDYERYLEIKCKDNKTLEELEIYLKHHKVDGVNLSDVEKDFIRSMTALGI
jgi:hypothetical protein